ncbi:MAG: guanylate kinase [Deltaproteobacteria bacterium]|nr:guanylate kinase [Deltaproteobacteria bacterium]
MKTEHELYIISGPSGAGKSVLCKKLLEKYPNFIFSVSYTTRKPRSLEIEGKDYFFINKSEFLRGIKTNRWLEWAKVHDNYYGTCANFVQSGLNKKNKILFDIDSQGTEQIVKAYPNAVTIFIMPPSNEALKNRLKKRGSDSSETIEKRLLNAAKEVEKKVIYKHIIINDQLDKAFDRLCAIINKTEKI